MPERGTFGDAAGSVGPWSVAVDWGDGSSTTFTTSAPGGLGTQTHTFQTAGAATVTVTVGDINHDAASAAFQVNVAGSVPVALAAVFCSANTIFQFS